MQIEIKNRFTGSLIFECDAVSLKVAVELVVSKKIDLRGADLRGADLRGANLSDANLRGADLRGADLRGANLRGANLRGANLSDANLRDADLRDANLRGADLRGADLSDANLRGANLRGADLRGADLSGVKIRDESTVTKAPIQITGLAWLVTIWDRHMQIGCEFHSHEDWENFSDEDWLRMGGKEALLLKRQQYPALAVLCTQHQPSGPVAAQEQDT